MQTIHEGKAKIKVELVKIPSKKMEVFYNPVMKLNRDIAVLLLTSVEKKDMRIADPLAGSGIRSIRFLLELKKSKIKTISINDYDVNFPKTMRTNLKLCSVKISKKITITNQEANLFLLNSSGFDYIDIDPFGTPNPFLDSAIKRISRDGILAVTATDTSNLCGTYPAACQRKYWAKPLRNELMHELGLRILIRKVQLVAAQYEKGLIPIFSHSSDHYMRVYFRCEKSKSAVDEIIKKHDFFGQAGPMWLGKLWDEKLVKKMFLGCDKNNKELLSLLSIIKEESKINTVGFYDIHTICKQNKLNIPKKEWIISKIKKTSKVSETHFCPTGIRSDIDQKKLIQLIQQLSLHQQPQQN